MGKLNETVQNINSAVRTVLAAGLLAVLGYLGYEAYDAYQMPGRALKAQQTALLEAKQELSLARQAALEQQEQIATLEQTVGEKSKEIERLGTSLTLLKVNQRIARLEILDLHTDPETGQVITSVEFVETNGEGRPLGEPKRFEAAGENVYVEYLVVKFNDEYVEQADLARGTAICLFQRIFGSGQKPEDGFRLDEPGAQPKGYERGGRMTAFEESIWKDFWKIASDENRREELGIRAAQGNAPFIRAKPGDVYELELRTTGEFTIRPVESGALPDGAGA